MTELELLQVIGYAQDVHILDAEELPEKKKILPFSKPVMRTIAALLALVLAMGLFLQTPMGAAAVEKVKEQVTRFLDLLFPPKDTVFYVEGEPVPVHVEAQGREPEEDAPGFSIYVDTESYTMTQEDGAWFIRPIPIPYDREEIRSQEAARLEGLSPEEQEALIDQRIAELDAFYASLPPTEMEIREIPDKTSKAAAEQVRAQMEGAWENLSHIWGYGRPETLCIDASSRTGWDAPREQHHFKENSTGGCFHIILRFYFEAGEGHGVRFHQMLDTFTLIAPQDPAQYGQSADARLAAIRQEVAYAQERDAQYEAAIMDDPNATQADMNIASYERSAMWQEVHNKVWTALEQTLDADAFQDLMAEQWTWAAQKRLDENLAREELGGGSLTGTVVGAANRKQTAERISILLTYLEGTAAPAPRSESWILDPKPTAEAFANAYFGRDGDALKRCLSQSVEGTLDVFSSGKEVVHVIKGLDNVASDMANLGELRASVEFRPTADSDYYQYLSVTLIWENNRWAVADFGLEG